MAGHRRQHGRPTAAQRRADRMATRIANAMTPEQRAAATFDALRSACRHSPERGPVALAEATTRMGELLAWVTERP